MTSHAMVARAAFTAGALAMAGAAAAGEWTSYVNPRFGAAAEIPARGFTADPPPENGDGQRWTSDEDGGTIAIYGAYQVLADDFDGYRTFALESARESGVEISYERRGPGWFVYSGIAGDTIVYERVEEACGGDTIVAIRFDYPKSAKRRWDPIVKHGAASLEARPSEACR